MLDFGFDRLRAWFLRRDEVLAALRESEARYRELVEETPDAIFIHADDRIVYVNRAGTAFLGATHPEQLIGRNRLDLIHPEDRQQSVERVRDLRAGLHAPRVEQRYLRLDGTEVSGEAASALVNWRGKAAVMVFVRDVTQRRQALEALERMRVAMDTAPDPIFVVDRATLQYVDVNAAACRLLGYTREELLALEPGTITEGFDRQAMRAVYDKLQREDPSSGLPEDTRRRLRRKDGSYLPVEIRRSLIQAGGRELVVAVARDLTDRLRAESAQERFRLAMDVAAEGIYLIDPATLKFVDANETGCRMLGYTRAELLQRGPADVLVNMTRAALERAVQAAIAQAPVPSEVERDRWLRHADGHVIPAEVYRAARVIDGEPVVIAVVRDVSDRRRADELLRLRTRAVEASDSAIMIVNVRHPDQPIEYVNGAFERITGYSYADALGRNCRFLQGEDRDQRDLQVLREAVAGGAEARVLVRNYRKDGRMFWNQLSVSPVRDDQGNVTHYVGMFSDVTELIRYRSELEHRVTHDALTGLANRELLEDRVTVALASAARHRRMLALAFLDLDGFKAVNDELGHDAGDVLLRSVARRLAACVRDADTVARLGGDEFVLLLTDPGGRGDVLQVLERVREAVAEPHMVEGRPVRVTCSIGVALFPEDGVEAGGGDALLRAADHAMYRAKTEGRNRICFASRAPS
jgi:diguanylate cyclase (GGDEF)-like protein/PAS domain S-box-containing protein